MTHHNVRNVAYYDHVHCFEDTLVDTSEASMEMTILKTFYKKVDFSLVNLKKKDEAVI